jgi:trk system potassium uptake protein TrkH
MGIGGNIGSTAGGIKIMRMIIIFKMIRHLILKIGLAAGTVVHPRYGGKRLETEEIERCFLLAFLFIGVVIISWLPFVVLGHPPIDSLFEVVSATGTVGLSTGITSAELAPLLKGILGVDMIMGRLEIIAFLILFFPYTWFGKRKRTFPKAEKK